MADELISKIDYDGIADWRESEFANEKFEMGYDEYKEKLKEYVRNTYPEINEDDVNASFVQKNSIEGQLDGIGRAWSRDQRYKVNYKLLKVEEACAHIRGKQYLIKKSDSSVKLDILNGFPTPINSFEGYLFTLDENPTPEYTGPYNVSCPDTAKLSDWINNFYNPKLTWRVALGEANSETTIQTPHDAYKAFEPVYNQYYSSFGFGDINLWRKLVIDWDYDEGKQEPNTDRIRDMDFKHVNPDKVNGQTNIYDVTLNSSSLEELTTSPKLRYIGIGTDIYSDNLLIFAYCWIYVWKNVDKSFAYPLVESLRNLFIETYLKYGDGIRLQDIIELTAQRVYRNEYEKANRTVDEALQQLKYDPEADKVKAASFYASPDTLAQSLSLAYSKDDTSGGFNLDLSAISTGAALLQTGADMLNGLPGLADNAADMVTGLLKDACSPVFEFLDQVDLGMLEFNINSDLELALADFKVFDFTQAINAQIEAIKTGIDSLESILGVLESIAGMSIQMWFPGFNLIQAIKASFIARGQKLTDKIIQKNEELKRLFQNYVRSIAMKLSSLKKEIESVITSAIPNISITSVLGGVPQMAGAPGPTPATPPSILFVAKQVLSQAKSFLSAIQKIVQMAAEIINAITKIFVAVVGPFASLINMLTSLISQLNSLGGMAEQIALNAQKTVDSEMQEIYKIPEELRTSPDISGDTQGTRNYVMDWRPDHMNDFALLKDANVLKYLVT